MRNAMSETRNRPVGEAADESQVRRAQRGVVAGYIHQLSERHGNTDASLPDAQPWRETREGG
jgi:hypothetical protein